MPHATPKNSTQNTPKIFCIKTPAPIPSKIATTIEMPSESPFAPTITERNFGFCAESFCDLLIRALFALFGKLGFKGEGDSTFGESQK